MLLEFVGNIFCVFDLVREDLKNAIDADQTNINSIGQACVVANSYGLDSGIHRFKIKVIKPGKDIIGIATNIHECIKSQKQWFYGIAPDTYFTWYNGSGTAFGTIDDWETHNKRE